MPHLEYACTTVYLQALNPDIYQQQSSYLILYQKDDKHPIGAASSHVMDIFPDNK